MQKKEKVAGLRLEEATDALEGFGEVFAKQAEASGVIPQITDFFCVHLTYSTI